MGELSRIPARDVAALIDANHTDGQIIQIFAISSHLHGDAYSARDHARMQEAVSAARDWLQTADYGQALTSLTKAREPAAGKLVSIEVAKLGAAFPNVGKTDLSGYGALLCEDVLSKKPTAGGFALACRKLRQTCRFVPTIAEVLEVLEQEEKRLRLAADTIRRLSDDTEKAAQCLAHARAVGAPDA